jgi:hypothetical protein
MIFGQKMTIIIITIIKHHNSKHYIYIILLRSIEYRHILHLRINEMLPKKKKILMNDLFYLEILFC